MVHKLSTTAFKLFLNITCTSTANLKHSFMWNLHSWLGSVTLYYKPSAIITMFLKISVIP